jgi:hypothetical protein
MRATRPAYLILLYFITNNIFNQHKDYHEHVIT